ncbi:STY4528 family pathogenicity island replication protein [Pseudomonas sp. DWP3-1-2]|uniref:STY4528 family pathogenicity island replication protein n=1 Tax=Pseudomonas sp. DWP3-1-2 TaxID=2804645 RepID=UPI003CE711A5
MHDPSRRFTPGNLDTLNALLDSASNSLNEKRRDAPREQRSTPRDIKPLPTILDTENTGILFTGNPHEAVPRRLLLDNRLTPLERNAWQVFRLLLNSDGLTSFPTYEQLQPYLAASPFKVASRETVAKTLTTLRLTRWLSLAGRVRDEVTGQMKGNIYLLHDEPISISEAMLLDRGYLELVGNSLEHANKSICQVAAHTLEEFAQDPDVREQRIPSRLDIIGQRVARQRWGKNTSTRDIPVPQSERGSNDSELSQKHSELSGLSPVRNTPPPGSESERCRKQGEFDPVRNPNSFSTGSNTNTYVFKSFVPRVDTRADYPPRFQALPPDQRQKAIVAMAPLTEELCKDVLDQWAARPVDAMRNPFAYLLRMIEKARNGEFNLMTQPRTNVTPVRTAARPEPTQPKPHAPNDQSKAIASQRMAAMMSLVKQRGNGPIARIGGTTA